MKKTKSYQKMFRGALAATLAAGAIVTVAPAVMQADTQAPILKDLEVNQDYYLDVLSLVESGVIKGFPDGTYKPYNAVSRGQAAKILAAVLGLDTENVENPGFTDVKETDEYYGAIAALANAGIINGFPDKSFKQRANLKRSQMAKILTLGFGFETETLTDSRFTDVKADDEFAGYVQSLLTNEITKGRTATKFGSYDSVLRGQMASFVVRAVKAKNPNVVIPTPPTTDPVPDTSANQLLNDGIKAALAGVNPVADKVTIALDGKTINVTIVDPTSTLGSFTIAGAPLFKAINDNATLTTVKLYVAGALIEEVKADGTTAIAIDAVIAQAFAKLGKTESDTLDFLKDKTFALELEGTIATAGFTDTYTFAIK